MPSVEAEAESTAEFVIVEAPSGASHALSARRPSGEVNHVLAHCQGEEERAFARRVIRRVRSVQRSGPPIGELCYVLHHAPEKASNTRRHLVRALLSVLEPGAVFTLMALQMSQADLLSFVDSLRSLAKVGVVLNVVM